MSEHDDRMRRLLEAEPTTSCEKWAAAKIRELEAQIAKMREEHEAEIGRTKREYFRQGADSYGGVRHPLDMD